MDQGDFSLDAVVNSHLFVNSVRRARNLAERSMKPINLQVQSKGLQPLGKMMGSIQRDASEFEKSLEASNARVLAFAGSTGVIFGLQQAFRGLIASTVEFETAMANIQSILNTTPATLQRLGREIFEISKNTATGFNETAQAASELARQGLNAEKTISRLNAAMILSRLSGMSATRSVEALTAIINGFNNELLNEEQILNRLSKVAASFAVDEGDLADAVGRAGSIAQDAGVSFNELSAIITSVRQITARSGSEIGNSFRTIFTRMGRSSTLDALENIGVQTRDSNGSMRDAMSILQDLAKVYGTLTDQQKSHISELVAGVYNINVLKAALGDLNNEFSFYLSALNSANTATDEAIRRNEELNKTISATAMQLAISSKQLGANVGEIGLSSGISYLLSEANSVVEWLNKKVAGDGEEAGSEFAQGLVRGIGATLMGPGLITAVAILAKFGGKTLKFMGDSIKSMSGMNRHAEQQRHLQTLIGQALRDHGVTYSQLISQLGSRAKAEEYILNLLRQQAKAAREVNVPYAAMAANPSFARVAKQYPKRSSGVGNFADPVNEAIGREMNSLTARGMSPAQARKQIFIGYDSRVGIAVGNYIDEPSGTIAEGVRREQRAGRNPRMAGMYAPNFADPNFRLNAQLRGETGQFLPHSFTEEINRQLELLEQVGPNSSQGKQIRKKLNEYSRVLGRGDKRLLAQARRNVEIRAAASTRGSQYPMQNIGEILEKQRARESTRSARKTKATHTQTFRDRRQGGRPFRPTVMASDTALAEILASGGQTPYEAGARDRFLATLRQRGFGLDAERARAEAEQGRIAYEKAVRDAQKSLGPKADTPRGSSMSGPDKGFIKTGTWSSSSEVDAYSRQIEYTQKLEEMRRATILDSARSKASAGIKLSTEEQRVLRKSFESDFNSIFGKPISKEMEKERSKYIKSRMRHALAPQIEAQRAAASQRRIDRLVDPQADRSSGVFRGVSSKRDEERVLKRLRSEQERAIARDKFAEARTRRLNRMGNIGLGAGMGLTVASGFSDGPMGSVLSFAGTGAFIGSAVSPILGTAVGAGLGAVAGGVKGAIDSMNPDLEELSKNLQTIKGDIEATNSAFGEFITTQEKLTQAIQSGDRRNIEILSQQVTQILGEIKDFDLRSQIIDAADGSNEMMSNLVRLMHETQARQSQELAQAALNVSAANIAKEFGVLGISRQSDIFGFLDPVSGFLDKVLPFSPLSEAYNIASMFGLSASGFLSPEEIGERSIRDTSREFLATVNLVGEDGELDQEYIDKLRKAMDSGSLEEVLSSVPGEMSNGLAWTADEIADFVRTFGEQGKELTKQMKKDLDEHVDLLGRQSTSQRRREALAQQRTGIIDSYSHLSFADDLKKRSQENARRLSIMGAVNNLSLREAFLSPQDMLRESIGVDMLKFEDAQGKVRDSILSDAFSQLTSFAEKNINDVTLLTKTLESIRRGESPDKIMKNIMESGDLNQGQTDSLKSMLQAFQQSSANAIEDIGFEVEALFEGIEAKVAQMRNQSLRQTIGGMDALDVGRRFFEEGNLNFLNDQMGMANQLPRLRMQRKQAEKFGGRGVGNMRLQEAIATQDLFSFWQNIGISLNDEQQALLDQSRIDVTRSVFKNKTALPMLQAAGVNQLTRFDPDVMGAVRSGDVGRIDQVIRQLGENYGEGNDFAQNLISTLKTIRDGFRGIDNLESPKSLIEEIQSQTQEIVSAIRDSFDNRFAVSAASARDTSRAHLEIAMNEQKVAVDSEVEDLSRQLGESQKALDSLQVRLRGVNERLRSNKAEEDELSKQRENRVSDFSERRERIQREIERQEGFRHRNEPMIYSLKQGLERLNQEEQEYLGEVDPRLSELRASRMIDVNNRRNLERQILNREGQVHVLTGQRDQKVEESNRITREIRDIRNNLDSLSRERVQENILNSGAGRNFRSAQISEFDRLRSLSQGHEERFRQRQERNLELRRRVTDPNLDPRQRHAASIAYSEDSRRLQSDLRGIQQDFNQEFKNGANELAKALREELGEFGKDLAMEVVGNMKVTIDSGGLNDTVTLQAFEEMQRELDNQIRNLRSRIDNQERVAQGKPAVF